MSTIHDANIANPLFLARKGQPKNAFCLGRSSQERLASSVKSVAQPVSLDNDVGFKAVVILSSALGIGTLAASLIVLEPTDHGFEFKWSLYAPVGFVVGALLAWAYWRLVFRLALRNAKPRESARRLKQAVIGLLVLGVLAFLYPLRYVAEERRTDVLIGLGAAIAALSGVGWMIRTVVVMLESEPDTDGKS